MVAKTEENAHAYAAANGLSWRPRGDSDAPRRRRRLVSDPQGSTSNNSHGHSDDDVDDDDDNDGDEKRVGPHVKIPSTARRTPILQRILNSTGRTPLLDHLKKRREELADEDDDTSDEGERLPQTIRRRVSRIFLQRFLKKQDVTCEADFCLYFEIAQCDAIETDGSNTTPDAKNGNSGESLTRQRASSSSSGQTKGDEELAHSHSTSDVHTVIDITAMMLRDAGCQVMLYPLQQADSESLPESKQQAQAYVMTIGYEDPSGCNAAVPEGQQVPHQPQPHVLPPHHQKLPPWVTLHPAYTKHILPLTGHAQTQQLTKLILKECRTDHNLYLANGALVFEAEKKLLNQLALRDDLTIQLYPLHRDDFRARMIKKWTQHPTYAPPLYDIYQYYGPKIAMYFAWLDFYTNMLIVPSICGVCLYVAGQFNAQSYSLLSFLLAIGTSVFVDLWRRKQREVEYRWKYQEVAEPTGTSSTPGLVGLDYIETRPEFKGEWMSDPVTHEHIYDFPRHKRLFRQSLAIPLLLSMCCVVGAYVVGLNMLSENLRSRYRPCYLKHSHVHQSAAGADGSPLAPSPAFCAFISHGPGVLNALIIYVMDLLYQQLAWKLNEFENYRTAEEFEDNLVLKRMPFHFVNSNASLWFLAFYVQNLERVRERLWILMVGMQLLDNFKEVGLPFVVSLTGEFLTADGRRRRRSSFTTDSDQVSAQTGPGAAILRSMPELKRQHSSLSSVQERIARVLMQKRQAQYKDTFGDYKEMMIQYGYVALYSPIFPLAPVFAWINNIVESRSDFLKLVNTHSYQRPMVQHTRGIGVWESVLVSFSVLAVIINFALVWTYELDDLLPSWSELHRFMFIIVRTVVVSFFKLNVLVAAYPPNDFFSVLACYCRAANI